ncbi:MAG: hypothetical protein EOP48_22680 [Sphingobacteriales bacterium]|nr:MAG: hypothetical protein EOP48_22680 [Sphingobacteriales bacterium]
MKVKLRYFNCLLVAFLSACTAKDTDVSIQFSSDSTAIVISNIDEAGLYVLKKELPVGDSLNHLISVLELPGDQDSLMMETELQGKISLSEKQLVFYPGRPFIRGRSYLVSTILNTKFGNTKEAMKSNIRLRAVPQQQTLTR